jgi:hypothetical protein
MQGVPSRTFTWPFVATVAAIGGVAAVVGVVLGWWQVTSYRESEIFGRELVEERTVAGTVHWTGLVALVVGLVVVGTAVASLVARGEGVRLVAGVSALAGGFFIMGAAALGLGQAAAVAEAQVGGAGLDAEGSAAAGLVLSALGGLVAVVAGVLARLVHDEA